MLKSVSYLTGLYRGRLNRATYLGGITLCFMLIMLEGLLTGLVLRIARIPTQSTFSEVMTYVDLVPVLFGLSTLYARRLHDIGASSKWLLVILVPIAAPILGVSLIFLSGEAGTNRYGTAPSADFDVRTLFLGVAKTSPAKTRAEG
jgi:uncharacterized membrane protein YhaH (DUF805 family)